MLVETQDNKMFLKCCGIMKSLAVGKVFDSKDVTLLSKITLLLKDKLVSLMDLQKNESPLTSQFNLSLHIRNLFQILYILFHTNKFYDNNYEIFKQNIHSCFNFVLDLQVSGLDDLMEVATALKHILDKWDI